jgi:hypothetical protein
MTRILNLDASNLLDEYEHAVETFRRHPSAGPRVSELRAEIAKRLSCYGSSFGVGHVVADALEQLRRREQISERGALWMQREVLRRVIALSEQQRLDRITLEAVLAAVIAIEEPE